VQVRDLGLDLLGAVDRGGVGDLLERERRAGTLIPQTEPRPAVKGVVLEDLAGEKGAGSAWTAPKAASLACRPATSTARNFASYSCFMELSLRDGR
jgi:hypothetical protein